MRAHLELFTAPEEDEDRPAPGSNRRCTPDLLLAWLLELGRQPTLQECKQHFGGILGPLFCGWELQRQGRWPGRV
jgi:hypothetical protein